MDNSRQRTAPQVLISHASEDKQRFVVPLATRLRGSGVDAWMDAWEINPGDSLIDKIFNEGLKNSQAMIVVLSRHSIDKPWVREELNAGMVKKITEKLKLIPIRLDSCDVPECLKHTAWQDIADPSSFDVEFERILNSIFGQYEKPSLGEPPPYTQSEAPELAGLSKIDAIIFALCCNRTFEVPFLLIDREWLAEATGALGISTENVVETQEVLHNRDFAKVHWTMGPKHICSMTVTEWGFNQFAISHPDYTRALESVALMIIRDRDGSSHEMMKKSDLPPRLIEHALFVLENNQYIRTTKVHGGNIFVDYVSPELRREIER
ncbi:MAG TPA: molecular chaperone Tir [Solibacterales bacterium]|nr:molecular chaperone Tir [Bryobacterales bacterium]